jgi:hypothetical protein
MANININNGGNMASSIIININNVNNQRNGINNNESVMA